MVVGVIRGGDRQCRAVVQAAPNQARWRTLRTVIRFVELYGHVPTMRELCEIDRTNRTVQWERVEALVSEGYVRVDHGERIVPVRDEAGNAVGEAREVRIKRGDGAVALSALVGAAGGNVEAIEITGASPGLRVKPGDVVICDRGRVPGRGEACVVDVGGRVMVRLQGLTGATGIILGLARSLIVRL